jgi:hypothetical protein
MKSCGKFYNFVYGFPLINRKTRLITLMTHVFRVDYERLVNGKGGRCMFFVDGFIIIFNFFRRNNYEKGN